MEKTYFCSVTENGEYEYTCQFLLKCKETEIDNLMKRTAQTFRSKEPGAETYEGSGTFWNDDGCTTTKINGCEEIPKDHYNILKNYITTL